MLEPSARDEIAGLNQRGDHRLIGVALVALVGDDALAFKARRVLRIEAVLVDRIGNARLDAARVQRARIAIQMSKSSRPWPGAVCTKPVPVSSVTWSPSRSGTSKS